VFPSVALRSKRTAAWIFVAALPDAWHIWCQINCRIGGTHPKLDTFLLTYTIYTYIIIYHLHAWIYYLVGGLNPPEKWWSSSVGIILPNIWKVIKFMFQTTNQ
jgi:hypothetical protein